jgi:hypothetical protein
VEAREDQRFFLRPIAFQVDHILLLDIDEAVEHAQPGIRLADSLPEVGYRVFTGAIGLQLAFRIACMAIIALVEWQEEGVVAIELRRHLDF